MFLNGKLYLNWQGYLPKVRKMNKPFFLGILAGIGASALLVVILYLTILNPQRIIEQAANKAVDQQVENLKEKAKSKLQDYLK